jgi:ribonucleoside-diphosphate reductase beta chain
VIAAGYGHFLRLAESLRWDEAAVDLSGDRDAWVASDETARSRILGLIGGFVVAEAAVAAQLGPFQAAAPDERMTACSRA